MVTGRLWRSHVNLSQAIQVQFACLRTAVAQPFALPSAFYLTFTSHHNGFKDHVQRTRISDSGDW